MHYIELGSEDTAAKASFEDSGKVGTLLANELGSFTVFRSLKNIPYRV